MSLAIDVDKVNAVLLADGWHKVADQSFDLDAYEYIHGSATIHKGGQGGVTSTGFRFKDDGNYVMYGPLTAILAVRRDFKPIQD